MEMCFFCTEYAYLYRFAQIQKQSELFNAWFLDIFLFQMDCYLAKYSFMFTIEFGI